MLGLLIVIALRVIIPLSILRWPLAGGLAAIYIDLADFHFFPIGSRGEYLNYVVLDKYLDIYYLSLEFVKVFSWEEILARKIAIFLYLYRLAGTALYLVFGSSLFFIIFPNLFENFYLFSLFYKKFFNLNKLAFSKLVIVTALLLVPKIWQEYAIHYKLMEPIEWPKSEVLQVQDTKAFWQEDK